MREYDNHQSASVEVYGLNGMIFGSSVVEVQLLDGVINVQSGIV